MVTVRNGPSSIMPGWHILCRNFYDGHFVRPLMVSVIENTQRVVTLLHAVFQNQELRVKR